MLCGVTSPSSILDLKVEYITKRHGCVATSTESDRHDTFVPPGKDRRGEKLIEDYRANLTSNGSRHSPGHLDGRRGNLAILAKMDDFSRGSWRVADCTDEQNTCRVVNYSRPTFPRKISAGENITTHARGWISAARGEGQPPAFSRMCRIELANDVRKYKIWESKLVFIISAK